MKINSYTPIPQSFGRITEAGNDKQGGAGSNAYERQKKKDQDGDKKEFEASLEAVEAAVESFSGDESTQSSGISAQTEGQGPGLKVVLKDSTGGILRSVSGEEFLRLREAAYQGRKSGRILDQKA
jgi:hypothetical protein